MVQNNGSSYSGKRPKDVQIFLENIRGQKRLQPGFKWNIYESMRDVIFIFESLKDCGIETHYITQIYLKFIIYFEH